MVLAERVAIIEKLRYESRIAFVAFCAERCIKEARLHPLARKQLEGLYLLQEGLGLLWARAERKEHVSPGTVDNILAHLSSYDASAPDKENVIYNYDVSLVDAANVVRSGLLKLRDPESATPRLVANALEGPYHTVSMIYVDYKGARKAETQIIDTALLRLSELGDKPFSQSLFEGIPEWERGPVTKKYAEGRLKGTAESEDE